MRLVVIQSNYIPWRGYFDLLSKADAFVVYDSVQYTKNDWRNRNKLVNSSGASWLTIPVETAGRFGQTIYSATVADGRWAAKHWRTASQMLGRCPYFDMFEAEWHLEYQKSSSKRSLSEINVGFIRLIAHQLGAATEIVLDEEIGNLVGSPTERLVLLSQRLGATSYLTGPAALSYLELDRFRESNVAVDVIDYSLYRAYPQRSSTFEPAVSILDLLANVGPEAMSYLDAPVRRLS